MNRKSHYNRWETEYKTDNGQTYGKKLSYKNKILTSDLQQRAQETDPLSMVSSSESQTTVYKLDL